MVSLSNHEAVHPVPAKRQISQAVIDESEQAPSPGLLTLSDLSPEGEVTPRR
jgi:hypothetical protein